MPQPTDWSRLRELAWGDGVPESTWRPLSDETRRFRVAFGLFLGGVVCVIHKRNLLSINSSINHL